MKLSKQSKELILFFSKNKHINYVKNTNKTNSILTELYNDIQEANYYVKKEIKYRYTIKKIQTATQITKPQNYNTRNFPDIVRNHINEAMMSEICYSFSLYHRNIKVYFIIENDNIMLEIEKYNKYLHVIATWLYILNMYANKECSSNLNIYFYFTSLKKNLPTSNIYILDETNVNTAFTTTCSKDSEIIIFRKEEWLKVFIHETFHNFDLDFSTLNNDVTNEYIKNIYKVKSMINAYEAYTEFWAEIINATIFSYYYTENNDINDFLSNCEFYINFERIYGVFQLVKTLDFMGLHYNDLYSNSKQSEILRENLYKENTNVLAYYIIKTVLMNNYQGFLSWCKTNNLSLIDFKKTIGNQKKFCEFIGKNYKTQSLLSNIHQSQIFLEKIKKKKEINKIILTNMRMSITELG
jgi:hypothetical protein